MKFKVSVIGAGNVGATTAQRIYEKGYSDVVLIDILEDMPQGKSLDMLESGPVLGTDANIIGAVEADGTFNAGILYCDKKFTESTSHGEANQCISNFLQYSSIVI